MSHFNIRYVSCKVGYTFPVCDEGMYFGVYITADFERRHRVAVRDIRT